MDYSPTGAAYGPSHRAALVASQAAAVAATEMAAVHSLTSAHNNNKNGRLKKVDFGPVPDRGFWTILARFVWLLRA